MHLKYWLGASTITILALALFVPTITKAVAEINLKEATLSGAVDASNGTFTVKMGDVPIKITYDTATKVSGTPSGLVNFVDWVDGAQLSLTGTVINYSNNQLKIAAREIKYLNKDIKVITLNGTLENVVSSGYKIYVSFKKGNLYFLSEIANVGQADGPRLVGIDNFNQLAVGSKVAVTQVWRTKPTEAKLRDLLVKKLANPSASATRVASLNRSDLNFSIEPGYQQPIELHGGNKLIIQNNTNSTLFLKAAAADQAKFTPALPNNYLIIGPNNYRQLTLAKNAPASTFSIPLRTDDDDAATPKVTIQVYIP